MQYHERIFHLIIILSISPPQLMQTAIVVALITAVACALNSDPPTEVTHKYMWLKNTPQDSILSSLTLPKAGNANYFTHLNNQPAEATQYQVFIDLYHDYYASSGSDLITCQTKNDRAYCQFVDSSYLSSLTEINPDKIMGELTLQSHQEKTLQLLSGQRIEMMVRSSWKDYIQFTLAAASVLLVMVGLYLARIVKYLDQRFILQLILSLCVFVRESIEYVREGIQNWLVSGWKFWLFIPLSIVTYQILESFLEACMSKRITLKGFAKSFIYNYFLYYTSQNMLLNTSVSYLALFYCQTDRSYQSSLPTLQKRAISQNSIQIMRILYTVLHLKLLFVKQFSYFVSFNPIYFLTGLTILMIIWQGDTLRLKKIKETKQREDIKHKIKVFKYQADLVAEISLYTVSDILDQQCAICYQKIDSDWAMTPCHHVFHADCLKEWLQKSETCPIDRKRALSAGPHKELAKTPTEDIMI